MKQERSEYKLSEWGEITRIKHIYQIFISKTNISSNIQFQIVHMLKYYQIYISQSFSIFYKI